jgi:hypothetical protein
MLLWLHGRTVSDSEPYKFEVMLGEQCLSEGLLWPSRRTHIGSRSRFLDVRARATCDAMATPRHLEIYTSTIVLRQQLKSMENLNPLELHRHWHACRGTNKACFVVSTSLCLESKTSCQIRDPKNQ